MKKIQELGTFEQWDRGTPDDIRNGKVKRPGYQEISCQGYNAEFSAPWMLQALLPALWHDGTTMVITF